jgi:hypothetical protein
MRLHALLLVLLFFYVSRKDTPPERRLSAQWLSGGRLELRRGPASVPTIKSVAGASHASPLTADLIIDLGSIAMTPFKNMYRFWTEVPFIFWTKQPGRI